MAGQALLRGVALALLVVAAFAAHARAQGGYTTERYPELGLSLPRARTYEAVPVAPSEELVVLLFAEKSDEAKARASGTRARPQLSVVWLERPAARKADDGASGSVLAAGAASRIDTIEAFVEARLEGVKLGASVQGREQRGFKAREFTFPIDATGARSGWAYAYENGQRTLALVGTCDARDLLEQVKIWRYSAEHLEIREPESRDPEKLRQLYAKKPLRAVDFRVGVRQALVRGWKAEDTDNYIVLYDTPDQTLVKKIARDLELLRGEYARLFPLGAAADTFAAVSAVRVCKSRDEFLTYGGPATSAGYWNAGDRELVLYDAETVDKQHRRSDADTFVALYHEAFHQYLHAACGELPLHPWFSEGHGDYFSGARVTDGKLRAIDVNPWRIDIIQAALGDRSSIPWKEIARFDQAEYYDPERTALCYAQGWSMVYFLRTCADVAKVPAWAQILPAYFDALKLGYADELAKLDERGQARDRAGLSQAIAGARRRAYDAAFGGVDLEALEQAWRTFILALPSPRRR